MDLEGLKRQAAARALEDVESGMKLGLGTGSTARHFVDLLGERVRGGLKVVGVPTSEATREQAEQCGIALTTLDDTLRPSTFHCTRLLISRRALGVTVKRELTRRALKSPTGRRTHASVAPGSIENRGVTPQRPV